jgi:Phytanoyl-CoA dioxygenase (PhyH)
LQGWGRWTGVGTPTPAYRAMRKLWPHVPWSVRRRVGRRRGEGVATDDRVVDQLLRDGVAVLDTRLPATTCAALVTLARAGLPTGDPDDLEVRRLDLAEPDLLADPTVQGLLVDERFRRLADSYLGGEAINDLAAMWWSVAQPGRASAAAAQQFHTDRDRLSFVEFFVYLTDVDEAHGPHVYVRGSHRHLPPALRADRRFTDAEVVAAYGEDALVQLTGPAGTVFAADTSGLHKGLPPSEGHRLVFQLEYTTTLFGAPYTRLRADELDPALRPVAEAHPRTYRRLLVA